MFVAGGDVSLTDDPDGDGWNNKKEFDEGTDPKISDKGTCGTEKNSCVGGTVENIGETDTDWTWDCYGHISTSTCNAKKNGPTSCPTGEDTTLYYAQYQLRGITRHIGGDDYSAYHFCLECGYARGENVQSTNNTKPVYYYDPDHSTWYETDDGNDRNYSFKLRCWN
jgi:hypothetical protein